MLGFSGSSVSVLGVISMRYCHGKHQPNLCLATLGQCGIKAQARNCKAICRRGSGLTAAVGLGGIKLWRSCLQKRGIILIVNMVYLALELEVRIWHGLGAWMLFHTVLSKEAVPGKAWLPKKP